MCICIYIYITIIVIVSIIISQDTSLPVAVFVWEVENNNDEEVEVSIMFSFQNSDGTPNDVSCGHYNESFTCRLGSHSSGENNVLDKRNSFKGSVSSTEVTGVLLHHKHPSQPYTFGIAAKAQHQVFMCKFICAFNLAEVNIVHITWCCIIMLTLSHISQEIKSLDWKEVENNHIPLLLFPSACYWLFTIVSLKLLYSYNY